MEFGLRKIAKKLYFPYKSLCRIIVFTVFVSLQGVPVLPSFKQNRTEERRGEVTGKHVPVFQHDGIDKLWQASI